MSQVTYVTLVPWGNETLRRDAMGNAISVVQLWIICVISQNWRPDVRCGDVMTRMLKSTWCAAGASFQEWSIALVGMPEVWPWDAASRSLGNQGYIRNLGRSPPGTSSCVETLWGTRCPRRHTCKSLLSVWNAQLWQGKRQARGGSQSQVVEPGKLGA